MDSITNYKNRALSALENKWGNFVLITFVYGFIIGITQILSGDKDSPAILHLIGLVLFILALPLTWGFQTLFLGAVRGGEATAKDMFEGYNKELFSRVLTTTLLYYVYVFLWSLLLLIPGCIKSYSYAMTPYILKDNPEMKNNAAIEESMRMMDGHKLELFLLDLSFIGWAILSILTCCIGFLWLVPYMNMARVNFYEDLKKASVEVKEA
jgi:integral membrane protein